MTSIIVGREKKFLPTMLQWGRRDFVGLGYVNFSNTLQAFVFLVKHYIHYTCISCCCVND